jgi:ribosomal protein S12 methylthiotransferase accessory factor YcaO
VESHGWRFRPSPKYSAYGVVRTVPPAETIRRMMPLMETVGVTRVAEITGLDRVGIPNFTAVRPRERGDGISYYNGKGLTRSAAKAGALMEAIERYSGESCDLPVYYGSREELERLAPAVDPAHIIIPDLVQYWPGLDLEWVEGYDLLSHQQTYLPLNAVVCPYDPPPGRPKLCYSSANGLASGNTLEEAVCHALCEVIERDAVAISGAYRDLAPAVNRILADIGVVPASRMDFAIMSARFPLIDPDSLPRRAQILVARLRRAGLLVYLRDISSTAGIATLDCAIVERRWDDRHVVHGGSGSHPDARVAVTRALTEAAQSRLGHIQGGREDLAEIVGEPAPFDPDERYGGGDVRPFSALASVEHPNVEHDIQYVLDRLRADGFGQVVAVDLTRPEVSVPVVRVVIPGAESWSVFVTNAKRGAFGTRVGRILQDAASGLAATLSGAALA